MEFSEINLLDILQEAAKSPLGIIALVILSLSIVGVILFKNSEDKYKFGVFVVLLLGVVTFTYASLQIAQPMHTVDYDVASDTPNNNENNSPATQSVQPPTTPLQLPQGQSTPSESAQKEGFIYLGTFRNDIWSDRRFLGADGALTVGEVITLSDSRKMFECAPYRKSIWSFNYTFCNDVIGNVNEGGKVEILKPPVSVGLDRVWVFVKEVE